MPSLSSLTSTSSVLLTFALADLEEDRKKFPECHTLYNNLQSSLGTDIEALKVTVTAEVDTARGPEIIVPPVENGNIEMNGGSEISKLVEEREGRGRIVAERKGKDVDELATAMSVVWVMYMRFARRAEVSRLLRVDDCG
jgi:cleavage stimulation factor subunit 3